MGPLLSIVEGEEVHIHTYIHFCCNKMSLGFTSVCDLYGGEWKGGGEGRGEEGRKVVGESVSMY